MAKITKDMIISDVLQTDRGTAPRFLNNGCIVWVRPVWRALKMVCSWNRCG